ncbi:MAG: hypothetical protein ACOVQE_01975 [Chitinophagaceae bacterium]
MDAFKKYMQEQMQTIEEVDTPSDEVWQKIDANLFQPTTNPSKLLVLKPFVKYFAAACTIVFIALAWVLLSNKSVPETNNSLIAKNELVKQSNNQQQKAKSHTTPKQKQPITEKSVKPTNQTKPGKNQQPKIKQSPSPSYQGEGGIGIINNLENSFVQVINLQRNRINQTPVYAENQQYFKEFIVQLNQLEKEEKILKQQVRQQGITNEVLNGLIDIYQFKLTILKQLQSEIQKTNSKSLQQQSPIQKSKPYFINI